VLLLFNPCKKAETPSQSGYFETPYNRCIFGPTLKYLT